jgi:hypothetical protein
MPERPTKTSNYSKSEQFNIIDYVRSIDADLRQLFEKFRTIFSINKLQVGSEVDYLGVTSAGVISLNGAAAGKLTLRPNLVEKSSKAGGTPTQVVRGINIGYSLPTWNASTRPDEELYFRMRIPIRWDGTTDPQFGMMTSLSGNEDVGDKFKFGLYWSTTACGGTDFVSITTASCFTEQTIITTGATAYNAYCVFFTFDADDPNAPIVKGDMLQARVRRIDASSSEVSNEIIVWDWASMWKTDKVYGAWSIETNV